MAGSTDWSALAAELTEAIRSTRSGELYPPEPGGPAPPGAVEAAEARLGSPLPEDYRSFLEAVDGWRGCLFDLDVYGTAELGRPIDPDGPVQAFFDDYLPELPEDTIDEIFGGQPDEALPIGASRFEASVVLVGRAGTPIAGRVIEHDGSGLATYDSMESFLVDRIAAARSLADRA